MADESPDVKGVWKKAIEASSPKMLRGLVGTVIFSYGESWIPNLPDIEVDTWLQYGFFGGAALSAMVMIYGILTGK